MPPLSHICIAGAGTIGTALAQVLADKEHLLVTLLSVEAEVVADINQNHINTAYFPQVRLNERIKATTDSAILQTAQVVFLAVPSVVVVPYVKEISKYMKPDAILVNLAKGFGGKQETIVKELTSIVTNPVCTLKGPTFARELIHRIPTAMTVGADDEVVFRQMADLFAQTTVHLDYTTTSRA